MPPIRTGKRFLFPDECPIPNCNSGRLQSITRAGEHFATKRHRELVRKLQQSGDAQYHEVFLDWARHMNYISVINEIPPRHALQQLAPNRQSSIGRNNSLGGKSLSSPQLNPPTIKEARKTNSVHAAEDTPITWLPPVVVNPTQAPSISSSLSLAEAREPRVIRWTTSTTFPGTKARIPVLPSSDSFCDYNGGQAPVTIYRGTSTVSCHGIPANIPPPALLPTSPILPIPHDTAPGYAFAPVISSSQYSLLTAHNLPSSQSLSSRTQLNEPSSDATVLEEDCEENDQLLQPVNIEGTLTVDRTEICSPVSNESPDAAGLSPSTIPDDQHMDSEYESDLPNNVVDELVTLDHRLVTARQTLLSPSSADGPLYYHPLLTERSSLAHSTVQADIIDTSVVRHPHHPPIMTFSAPSLLEPMSSRSVAPITRRNRQPTLAALSENSCEINGKNDRPPNEQDGNELSSRDLIQGKRWHSYSGRLGMLTHCRCRSEVSHCASFA
ncbi:hypothetical protein V1509DRAFT_628103 [Lipomyces kononenkoae]